VAYVRYLEKTFWPANLSIFYRYAEAWPFWLVGGSVLLLLVITMLAVNRWRQQPFLIVGWLWFIGMMVPTIGLIQVGEQSMADRYSYLSIVGIFIMVAWGVGDFSMGRAWVGPVSAWAASGALLACSMGAAAQVGYWRDTGALFGHAVKAGPNNDLAYYNLACYLAKMRDPTNAAFYFERCLESNPRYHRAYNNVAFLQIDQGQFDAAISNLQKAVQLRHDYPEAWLNLGRAYSGRGDAALAKQSFETSLRYKPDLAEAHYHLGELLLQQGAFPEAAGHLQAAVSAQPRNSLYHLKLANAWVGSDQIAKAVNEYEITLKLDPDLAEACNNLAWIMATSPDAALRDGPLAMELARHAVELAAGKSPLLLGTFAAACAEDGKFDQAVRAAAQARQLALAQTNNLLAAGLAAQVNLYRARQPFRDAHIK
jgi:tetratricopeptide (TPR) repeat protein